MARRVRAEAKSLRRCAWAPAVSTEAFPRPPASAQPKADALLEVVRDRQTVEHAPPPPAPSDSGSPAPVVPAADSGASQEAQVASDASEQTALPVFAQAPVGQRTESVMVNAFAMVNPPPPWNALAECRQQAERLAELENEVLEECRKRQEQLFRAELQEKQDENEQRWKHHERELEAQIALLERRVMETRLSNQESEMQLQQDARARHQVVQERCNVLATNLAEEQAEFNAKHFQVEQRVSSLQAELQQSQKEMEAMKFQERTLFSCNEEELSAEARCARYVQQRAEQHAELAEQQSHWAEEVLSHQQRQHCAAMTSFQEQHFQLEERLQHSEHLEQNARRLSVTEEALASRAQEQEQRQQQKTQEIQAEKEDLASSVRVLTAEICTSQKEVTSEHEQWQMLKMELKEARQEREGLLTEVRAAQDFAADAAKRAEAEQRERLRDLKEFQRILRQHQECLDLQQRKEIWAELQEAVIGSSEVVDFEAEFPCEQETLNLLGLAEDPCDPALTSAF